ncbi:MULTISPECIES: aldehyde dehydrogenase family protein [Pseudomonas]|uniref:aldehyde dehydrogenase family protein n=1 Tax=Pseudomonas nitroreducens TaxID=46680 RepID=UPI001E40897A|nr:MULTISPECIES: aldehyde dehydrogenase family protein [Pseudomonas]MCE4071506.1 aldehyde dehydrogenase family protein [Pseudomonas nitritireducens]MCE4081282.1 aldehyde dehydrogenase family protein [Pseudomonas nitroreducens]
MSSNIESIFARQRATREERKAEDASARAARLKRLREVIVTRIDDIEQALHADLRRTPNGGKEGEIPTVLAEIDNNIAHLEQWMAPQAVPTSPHFQGCQTFIQYEPRGVVLLLGAWNFPFALVLQPLVPIVAAGNSAMVKPNELSPATSAVVAEIIREVFEEQDVAVFEGGIEVAERLQQLPFDHVFFTGSPAVGRLVMAAAARHLTSVTLELGGKCPAIVAPDYDLVDAAGKVTAARFNNAGQLCLSVDHAWVPRAVVEPFCQIVGAVIDKLFYENGELQLNRLPRLVNERNFDRVLSYIDDAVARGARIVRGGQSDRASLTIHPTVLVDVPKDAKIMQEEIFGPVLPVLAYEELCEVTDTIDAHGKPLAMYIFAKKKEFVDQTLLATSSGGVTVNHVFMHYVEPNLPFGGVNGSGMGRYHGHAGFLELSNARSMFIQA